MKVLMVCLGNICRSPMAQGILESKVSEQGLNVEVDSAGTAAYHIDEHPDTRAIAKTNEYGIDISYYRGRQIAENDFDDFDLIYVMDNYNFRDVLSISRNEDDRKKVDMIMNSVFPGDNMSVPDPYYGGGEGFENVYQLLDKACDKIIERLMYDSKR